MDFQALVDKFVIATYIVCFVSGCIFGLAPLVVGIVRKRWGLGFISFAACGAAGALIPVFGMGFVPVPMALAVVLALILGLAVQSKRKSAMPPVNPEWQAIIQLVPEAEIASSVDVALKVFNQHPNPAILAEIQRVNPMAAEGIRQAMYRR